MAKKKLNRNAKNNCRFCSSKKPGWILFTFLILVSLDENYKQVEKSFPKIMKESHDLNIKETFQIFVVFRSKYHLQTAVSFKNGKIHHSFFMPVYISKKISFFVASGQKCFVI